MKQTGSKGISRRRFLAAGGASAGLAALLPGALASPRQEPAAPNPAPGTAPSLPGAPGPAFHQGRIAKLREMMKSVEAAALVEMPGAGMRYLTGLGLERRERLVCLVVPLEEPPVLFCSDTQRELAAAAPLGLESVAWGEEDDPVTMVGRQIKKLDADNKKIVMSGAARYDEFLHLHSELPKATFVSGNALAGYLREHKELEEIGILRPAAEACQRAVETTLKQAREGITVGDLSAAAEQALRQATGGGWARARCGKDTAAPLIWSPERRLARGDVIVLEGTAELHGYKARVVRTGVLGAASGRMKLIHSTLRKAQDMMMERMKPGQPWSYVDRIGRSTLGGGGFSKMIRALLGRGIGLDQYEPPYLAPGYHDPAAMGHVLSLDPGVYTPNDYGIEVGEMIEITAAGARFMTQPPESIFEIS